MMHPIVTAPVNLGAIDEDGSIRITSRAEILKNSSDVDGDEAVHQKSKSQEENKAKDNIN